MCGGAVKKVFGGGSHKQETAPPPAVAQATPGNANNLASETKQGETNTNAKGKKKLIINKSGVGTGVNL